RLLLYPTNACNLRCIYCYATSGPAAGPRLGHEQAIRAVHDFFDTLDEQVRFVTLGFHGGGEPTTQFHVMLAAWESFQQRALQMGLVATVETITNGNFGSAVLRTLLQPEWRLFISYDGPRQGLQRPTASERDSRPRVVANLRALRAAGKVITTRATVTHDGLDTLRALVEDAAEIGIHRVQLEPASIIGRGANLRDGPPEPLAFADAFLDAFRYALHLGIQLSTSAWSHTRVGNGRYCAAISGTRALTPDGFLSACTEVVDGRNPDDPFIVGRQQPGQTLTLWPMRETSLQSRTGYAIPVCRDCFMCRAGLGQPDDVGLKAQPGWMDRHDQPLLVDATLASARTQSAVVTAQD
ncbi:MAG: radical SAM protein, partial [Lamprobacter sp.]|uniref:radical SAM protein n=1 Tax=Lamprobacter sp. TaxID=3100796 RepID=UPI002B25C88D